MAMPDRMDGAEGERWGGEAAACRPVRSRNSARRQGEKHMKIIVLASAVSLALISGAFAVTCKEDTAAKKLAGAAATSHMKKCEADAKAKCETDSDTKKLAGAARTSHVKKCVTDAVGN